MLPYPIILRRWRIAANFGGVGFKILDNLSIGANIGYLYGKLNYQTTASLSNGGDQTITYNTVSISSYNASFGLQYTQPINKQMN